ncbi:TraC family protein [Acidithiobacillus sp. M4-SHS-6]|uniref:TraG/VirB4 family ATPase n=1 Tax=Acidithiobacillus sp. M4-SHS-6 TaxID=3383024 RepID=UPI0039BEBEDE
MPFERNSKIPMTEKIQGIVQHYVRKTQNQLKVDEAHPEYSLPVLAANELSERTTLSSLLPYADITPDGIVTLDDGYRLRSMFSVQFSPFTVVGTDAESVIEGIIGLMPAETVVQFGVLSNALVAPQLDAWAQSRQSLSNPSVANMAKWRRDFLLATAYGPSAAEGRDIHPRHMEYVVTVSTVYGGEIGDEHDWRTHIDNIDKLRTSVVSSFQGSKMGATALRREGVRRLLRFILNPHFFPDDIVKDEMNPDGTPYYVSAESLVAKETRVHVTSEGGIVFSASSADAELRRKTVGTLTMDGYPKKNHAALAACMIGDALKTNESIPFPFWLYVNISIPNQETLTDKLSVKMAGVGRQTRSDSPTVKALMSHLFDMHDELKHLVDSAKSSHPPVRAYVGLNIYTTHKDLQANIELVKSLWRRHGYRVSPERNIALPVWLCSLPGYYVEEMDEGTKGLQRSTTMSSSNASMIVPIRGEWQGTPPEEGGLPLLSRQNQLSFAWVQNMEVATNYNFVIVAASGSGKSFLAQDIIGDFLAKEGYVFVIDAGRSYFEMCEDQGGVNLVFRPEDPVDLNPFDSIDTENDLKENMELLLGVVRYMAFPHSEQVGDFEYAKMEQAIDAAWRQKRGDTRIADVEEILASNEDSRVRDIAAQMRPFVHGRHAAWFNGEGRKIDFYGAKFVVTEMDDLKSQGSLRDVVLTLMMNRIAHAMYLADAKVEGGAKVPKLMLIDEAWDLLANNRAGDFIERAYRTYRKYRGSAGVITQSFKDFDKSAAATAAYENAAWLFMLRQKPESLEAAFTSGKLMGDDEYTKQLLRSVHTVPGAYSEIYVRCDEGQGVYRFIADPYAYWLYTTAPTDKEIRGTRMQHYMERGMPRLDALGAAVSDLARDSFRKRWGTSPTEVLRGVNIRSMTDA